MVVILQDHTLYNLQPTVSTSDIWRSYLTVIDLFNNFILPTRNADYILTRMPISKFGQDQDNDVPVP
jgi:hypothetical protein